MMIRHAIVLGLCLGPLSAAAATCTWNAPTGNWSVPTNWAGCSDAPGPSTRSPGSGDIAVVANGTASYDLSAVVAELEIASNGVISTIGSGELRSLAVTTALRLNGGTITTQLGQNQLTVALAVGATGTLLAPTTLDNATFLENSGTLALGSANGTALSLLVAAQLRNMPAGTISFTGGDSRLVMSSSAELKNNVGATLLITGNMLVSRPPAAFTGARFRNFGSMMVNGPGMLNLAFGSAISSFEQSGQLTLSNATLVCNQLSGEQCSFLHNSNSAFTGVVTRLDNATLDLGGATADLSIPTATTLTGTGNINARVVIGDGTFAPGALSGAPYGDLAISGAMNVGSLAALDFDLGGNTPGSYDRVVLGGKMTVAGIFTPAGQGTLNLRLAAGYQPAIDTAVPIVSYPSFEALSSFRRVDANYGLDYAARFDPTALRVFPAPRITIENVSVVEGNSGDVPAVFNVRLSQASTQAVTALVEWSNGTATVGSTPTGDFAFPGTLSATFTPGQTLQTLPIQVHGDSVAEADEGFTLTLVRNRIVNAAVGSGVPGNVVASGTIVTDDLPPGTRFILVGKDESGGSNRVRRYTTTGTFIDAWGPFVSNTQGHVASGLCFSPQGNILSTRFAAPSPVYYSPTGAILDGSFGVAPGYVGLQNEESCAFDLAGNVYMGQASVGGVKKFNRLGVVLDSFDVPIGPRGSDWIDLAGDQCTLYYTSEGTTVRRYNVCTHSARADFATGLTPPYCYALRRRPNGELMVACQEAVHRLSPLGAHMQVYTRQSIGETESHGLFALNLDPDGSSFWTAGVISGNVYRVDIASGAVLASFNSGAGGVSGLAVYGQLGDDTIFVDGFDPPMALVPLVPTGPSTALYEESECAEEFWPKVESMPHYVPAWVSLVVKENADCAEHE